jgi:hypothetical protein
MDGPDRPSDSVWPCHDEWGVMDSIPGRSGCEGETVLLANLSQDVSPPPRVRPSLALEHFEHRDLGRRQRIALDRLEVHGLQATVAGRIDVFG